MRFLVASETLLSFFWGKQREKKIGRWSSWKICPMQNKTGKKRHADGSQGVHIETGLINENHSNFTNFAVSFRWWCRPIRPTVCFRSGRQCLCDFQLGREDQESCWSRGQGRRQLQRRELAQETQRDATERSSVSFLVSLSPAPPFFLLNDILQELGKRGIQSEEKQEFAYQSFACFELIYLLPCVIFIRFLYMQCCFVKTEAGNPFS